MGRAAGTGAGRGMRMERDKGIGRGIMGWVRTAAAGWLGLAAWAGGAPGSVEPLVVATREVPPFAMRDDAGTWSGITIELWERIARELDLPFRYEEHTIESMLDGLRGGTVDIAAAALTITSSREHFADFSHPFYITGLGIAVARQHRAPWLRAAHLLVSGPFLRAAGLLILLLLISGALVWLCERRRNARQFPGSPAQGIASGFWWSAVTLTTVGYGDKAPVTVAGRLLALAWMFGGLLLISSLTAAIASALTLAHLDAGIRGPEDLSRRRVASLSGTTGEKYLAERGLAVRGYANADAALSALEAGEVDAVVYDEPILRHFIRARHAGRLRVLPHRLEEQHYGFGLPLRSPLRKPLNRALLQFMEGGELDRIVRRHLGE